MIEYGEATAIRRSARLVSDSAKPSFSFLNILAIVFLLLLVVEAIRSAF